jgi:4,5-DOPA dioxygenase extradiol
MPALFIGHGSPMNAIEDNEFSQAWAAAAAALPRTIHDFYGFPDELFAVQYKAPGSLQVVEAVRAAVRSAEVSPET